MGADLFFSLPRGAGAIQSIKVPWENLILPGRGGVPFGIWEKVKLREDLAHYGWMQVMLKTVALVPTVKLLLIMERSDWALCMANFSHPQLGLAIDAQFPTYLHEIKRRERQELKLKNSSRRWLAG